MDGKRKIVTVGGTMACALAIGYFMQHDAQVTASQASLVPPIVELALLEPVERPDGMPLEIEDIRLTSAQAPAYFADATDDMLIEAAATALDGTPATPIDPQAPAVLGCAVAVDAAPSDLANVHLTVVAPCMGNERITVHHNGMMFTEVTDAAGRLAITVPALNSDAVFIVEFDNGMGGVAMTNVPDIAEVDRVVLQWSGKTGFEVHAREFGADYGTPGHVWTGAETDRTGGGMIVRLGQEDTLVPQLAEVYTFPKSATVQAGTISLSVEAEVTEMNCGRDIAAQSLELRDTGKLRTRELVLAMPNCSALGDFLVLNNLMEDLKIAAR